MMVLTQYSKYSKQREERKNNVLKIMISHSSSALIISFIIYILYVVHILFSFLMSDIYIYILSHERHSVPLLCVCVHTEKQYLIFQYVGYTLCCARYVSLLSIYKTAQRFAKCKINS